MVKSQYIVSYVCHKFFLKKKIFFPSFLLLISYIILLGEAKREHTLTSVNHKPS